MSQLTTIDPRMKTMSTREIAELTGKKIGHVNRDADLMISALKLDGIDDPELDHVRIDRDARGYITSIALPQGLSITLVIKAQAADIMARVILTPAAAVRWLHHRPDILTTGAALIAGAAGLYIISTGA